MTKEEEIELINEIFNDFKLITNKIYDEFKSRTCENCTKNLKFIQCQILAESFCDESNFGCMLFERKVK